MLAPVLILLGTFAVLVVLVRSMSRWETGCAFAGFALHTCFAWAQVWLYTRFYHGVGDMFGYLADGRIMARLMSVDFSRFGWETLKVFLHVGAVSGAASTTGAMTAATGFILFLVGDSALTACLFVAALATVTQTCLYLLLRRELAAGARRGAAVALLLIPSVVFWSSGVTKEGLTLSFLATLMAGALLIARGRWVVGTLGASVGAVGVAMIKPYVLFPFVLGVAAWAYVAQIRRRRGRFRVSHVVLAVSVAVVGLAVAGALFPEYSVEHFAKSAARQQGLGTEVGGGSYIQVGDADARTFWQQLPFIPVALVDSMFRPFIFEARNAPMLGAALESTILTVASIALLVWLRWRRVVNALKASPLLAFCVVFTVSFAVAVGLATTNLGTLSRYRMPMMPCYVLAAVLLWNEERAGARARAPRAATAVA